MVSIESTHIAAICAIPPAAHSTIPANPNAIADVCVHPIMPRQKSSEEHVFPFSHHFANGIELDEIDSVFLKYVLIPRLFI